MGTTSSTPPKLASAPPSEFFDSPIKPPPTCIQKSACQQERSSFWDSLLGTSANTGYVKVLFCGKDHFPSAFVYTTEELLVHRNVLVVQCEQNAIEAELHDTHVLVTHD